MNHKGRIYVPDQRPRRRASWALWAMLIAIVLAAPAMVANAGGSASGSDNPSPRHESKHDQDRKHDEDDGNLLASDDPRKDDDKNDDSGDSSGDSGKSGDSGDSSGKSGDTGKSGDSGDSGNSSGDSGKSGDSGDSGKSGDSGNSSGDSGKSGDSGDSGKSGDSGDSGNSSGDSGKSGDSGDSGNSSGDSSGDHPQPSAKPTPRPSAKPTPRPDPSPCSCNVPPVGGTRNIVADAFGRSSSGSWGSAATGGLYTLQGTAANYSVNSGKGIMTLPAAGQGRAALLNGVSARDVELRFRVSPNRVAAGGAFYVYGVARRNGTSEYRTKLIFNANGTVSVHASVLANGAESSLGAPVVVAGLRPTAGSSIWLRAQVTGANPTTIRIRAWLNGQAEPSSWQFNATNSQAVCQAAGSLGLRSFLSASSTNAPLALQFDDFVVRTL